MYFLPQEIEAWYIIPAIRKEIASCLVKDYEISYERVGNLIGVSKAAISQYLKGKRAAKIKLPKEVSTKVMHSCKLLINDKSSSATEINKLLDFIRNKSLKCCICSKLREGVLEDCKEIKFCDGNYEAVK